MVYNKRHSIMKKWTLLLTLLIAFVSLNAQNERVRIAVIDFIGSKSVDEKELLDLSDMLINSLNETGKLSIVERSQINQVLQERGFQLSGITREQLADLGKILDVKLVLIGEVDSIASKYNVKVSAVDVKTGEITATEFAPGRPTMTFKLIGEIGKRLANKIFGFRKSGFTLRSEMGMSFLGGFKMSDAFIPFIRKNHIASYISSTQGIHIYDQDIHIDGNAYDFSRGMCPAAEIAFGYQIPHFFMGVIGGYGGTIEGFEFCDFYYGHYLGNGYYREYGHLRSHVIFNRFPIKADIRWYLFNRKYDLLFDIQAGVDLSVGSYDLVVCSYNGHQSVVHRLNALTETNALIKIGVGFTMGNYEATITGEYSHLWRGWRYGFNFACRFGNVIKNRW